MLIQHQPVNAPEVQGIKQIGTFGFLQDRQMFDLLSNQLYTRKEEASVREPCCNAMDAHLAAGKPTTPIEVWAPTSECPVFRVRDYGLGMSYEMLTQRYPTYGWSDKRNDEESTGGFGLGCKAPLAYLNNFDDGQPRPFTVESVHNGLRNVILCALNEQGTPGIHQVVHDEPTTDRSGVTVSFEVDPAHIQKFHEVIRYVFLAFDVQPIVYGLELYPREITAGHGDISLVNYGSNDYVTGPSLTLANVTYPVRNFKPNNPLINDWLVNRMNLRIQSGPRIMAPSREALMETKGAKEFIELHYQKAIEQAYKAAYKLMHAELSKANYSSLGMAQARKALIDEKLYGLPFKALGFVQYCGVEEASTAQLMESIAKREDILLPLPEFMLEKHTGLRLVVPFMPKDSFSKPKMQRLSVNGSYELKSKGSRYSNPQKSIIQFSFKLMRGGLTDLYSPEIVLLSTGSATRRVQSEIRRRADGNGRNTAILCIRVKPKELAAAHALLDKLKEVNGYADLTVTDASSFELLPEYVKDCDLPKVKTAAPATIARLPSQVLVLNSHKGKSWGMTYATAMEGEAALEPGVVDCYMYAKGVSLRRGMLTKYCVEELLTHSVLPFECSLMYSAHHSRYNALEGLAYAIKEPLPSTLLVTNQKMLQTAKEENLKPFSEYLLDRVKGKLETFSPVVIKLSALRAAIKLSSKSGYANKEAFQWAFLLDLDSVAVKELMSTVRNRKAKAAIKECVPELFKSDASYTAAEVAECTDILLALNSFVAHHYARAHSLSTIFDGKQYVHAGDLIKPLYSVNKSIPHLNPLLKAFSGNHPSHGMTMEQAFTMGMNFVAPANEEAPEMLAA